MDLKKLVLDLCKWEDEPDWFEFKVNWYEPVQLCNYISGLSNSAAMEHRDYAYFVWGVTDDTHEIVGTDFNYQRKYKNEPLQSYISHNLSPRIKFKFDEVYINKQRVVVLTIDSAEEVPTSSKEGRFIRIGGSNHNLKDYPKYEVELFKVLMQKTESIVSTPSQYQDLTFRKLFSFYGSKEIELNKKTFEKNLGLRTKDGQYNVLAQLLSDNSHISIRVSVFDGESKADKLYSNEEFGNDCILYSLDNLLRYGDVINIMQADETNRVMVRKEVALFDKKAFREAIINAVVHNNWTNGNGPMISVFTNRIDIVSHGTITAGQTKEGFFEGVSIPVNQKLSDIFLQLHISERSGRGVPKIVTTYGEDAYTFLDNAIKVTIPFNKIDSSRKLNSNNDKQEIHNTIIKNDEELNETAKLILSEMRDNPNITSGELITLLSLSKSRVEYNIKMLKEKGYISRGGSRKAGYWKINK